MLPNSNGNPGQKRHRQHRRQISTPTIHDAAKVPNLPAQAIQRYHAHRRGQSLDQRSLRAQRPSSIQDGTLPTTNTAIQQPRTSPQNAQHKQFAPQIDPSLSQTSASIPSMPDCQLLSEDDLQAIANCNANQSGSNVTYIGPNFMLGSQGMEAQPVNTSFNKVQQQHLLNPNPAGDNAVGRQLLDNDLWDDYRQHHFAELSQQANNMPRRLSAQSDGAQSQLPNTPARWENTGKSETTSARIEQIPTEQTDYNPITPVTTPFKPANAVMQKEAHLASTKNPSLSVPSTSDLSDMQRARSLQGVVGTTFTQPKMEMPSPPNTASFDFDSNDVFDCKQGSSFERPESNQMSHHHYTSSVASSSASFYSTPELADMPSPGASSGKAAKVPILPITPTRHSPSKRSSNATPATSPSKAKLSPRPASIDNLNLDNRVNASINETGVTMDEIASFIFGPDPEDGKWVCLHPQCARRFGRKENIKSHVQTHLGDRQYKCEHCGKCFVRGHDLKRHAKIHTGDKPYECPCGNVFARHDALTRHRQRGMCVGGYQGVVRKAVKRGRPKKHRPEMGERQEKATRTRQRAAEKLSSTESISGCSEISHNSPPSEFLDSLSLRGHSPAIAFTSPNYSLPPEVFTFTPPASPHANSANKQSPGSPYRSLTPSTEDEMPPYKRAWSGFVEESGLPFISDYQYPDLANPNSSSAAALSSPHTAPTLTDSTTGSDLELFINQDTGASFDADMASFPDYTSTLDDGMDLFPPKSLMPSVLPDEMLRCPNDELPSDMMSKDFFMD